MLATVYHIEPVRPLVAYFGGWALLFAGIMFGEAVANAEVRKKEEQKRLDEQRAWREEHAAELQAEYEEAQARYKEAQARYEERTKYPYESGAEARARLERWAKLSPERRAEAETSHTEGLVKYLAEYAQPTPPLPPAPIEHKKARLRFRDTDWLNVAGGFFVLGPLIGLLVAVLPLTVLAILGIEVRT